MTRDLLREALAERERNPSQNIDPPVTCGRCGGIFDAPIRDTAGKVLVPGHVQGNPVTCIAKASPTGSARDARARRAARAS